MTVSDVVIVLGSVLGMEGVSYLSHRFLMHGPGMGWHRSHHVPPPDGGFEKNDLYPLCASSVAVLLFALGTWGPRWRELLLVGVGLTLYGVSYLFVHEVYIHRRLPSSRRWSWRAGVLDRLRAAHRIHHLYGGEPYGMLLPYVPKELRERAARTDRDPLAGRATASV